MPAAKPKSLNTRHDTAAETAARHEQESIMRPGKKLPMSVPQQLKGHDVAAAAWRRLRREFESTEGEIVTRFDQDLMVDYCILLEQTAELDLMRKTAYAAWLEIEKKHAELLEIGDADKAVYMAIKVVGAFEAIIKLDSRVDRKRALMLQHRQSMYLTPRARAGVAPKGKEKPQPIDPLAMLLDNVTGFVNGDDGAQE